MRYIIQIYYSDATVHDIKAKMGCSQLEPGDGVTIYTDGIPEARNINKNFYGIERLCEVVSINWHKSAEQIKQATIDDLRELIGEQKVFDDITLVVLKQQGNIVRNLEVTVINQVSTIFDFTAKADSGIVLPIAYCPVDRMVSFAENAEATQIARWE